MVFKNNRGELITNSGMLDYLINSSYYEMAINEKVKQIISFMNDEGWMLKFENSDFISPYLQSENDYLRNAEVQFATRDIYTTMISIPWIVFQIENPHEAAMKWIEIMKEQGIYI